MESIGILAMVIMGGLGNIRELFLGNTFNFIATSGFERVINILRDLTLSGAFQIPSQRSCKYEKLVFKLILILMCIFRPKGMLPAKRGLDYKRNV
jgi:branched-chain amino acid transport system permease protein